MVYTALSSVEIGSADIRVSYTSLSRHVPANRVGGRLRTGLGALMISLDLEVISEYRY